MTKKIIEGKIIYLRNLHIKDIDNGWLNWVNEKSITKHMPYVRSKKKKRINRIFKKK